MGEISVEVRILGPIQLAGAAGVVQPAGRRQRVVLSMLALNVRRLTPVAQLIDAVWDGTPPNSAHSQIQICVSGLRKLMRAARCVTQIRTRPPGYLLDGEDLDSRRFGRLVDAARAHENAGQPAEAVRVLRSALGLWRGPALANVTGAVVGRAAAGLNERRMSAEVDLMRLELHRGRHTEILPELHALTERYPLHEELHGYLMLALARCGREREATEVFHRAHLLLTQQVGIEPGERLRDLLGVIAASPAESGLA